MTDVQKARIEAAARAIADCHNPGMFEKYPENWRVEARAALEAADAAVTVDMIVDELAGHPIGSGYYQMAVSVDEAREMAEIIQRLYRGEEQS